MRFTPLRIFLGSWLILAWFLNPIPYSKAKGHIVSTRMLMLTGSWITEAPAHWSSTPTKQQDTELTHQLGEYAFHEGKIYPKYPPGMNVLLAPLYAAAHWLAPRWDIVGRVLPDEDPDVVITNCLGTLLLTAPSAAGIAALTWWLVGNLTLDQRRRMFVALIAVFGTLLFFHGTGLYSKPISGMLSFAAFGLVWKTRSSPANRGSCFAAGLLAGVAACVDYQVGITMLILLAYAAVALPWRQSAVVLLGATVPMIALMAFHWQVLGHPLRTTYSFAGGHRDAFGLGMPRWFRLVGLTIGLNRGVLWHMPIVLVGLAGLGRALFRDSRHRAEAATCLCVIAGHFAFNLAARDWTSGAGFGPRYLIPALPFATLWIVQAFEWLPSRVIYGVAALSAAVSYLGAQAYFIPINEPLPLRRAWQTLYTSGGSATRVWRILLGQWSDKATWNPDSGVVDPGLFLVLAGHFLTLALIALVLVVVVRCFSEKPAHAVR